VSNYGLKLSLTKRHIIHKENMQILKKSKYVENALEDTAR